MSNLVEYMRRAIRSGELSGGTDRWWAQLYSEELTEALIGKRLGVAIHDSTGRPILHKGVVLTSAYIGRLRQLGYTRVYVQNELVPDIEVGDAITVQTRVQAVESVRQVLTELESGDAPTISRIHDVVSCIIDEICENGDVAHAISVVRSIDEYTLVHSVNVAVLTLIIARSLGFSQQDLQDIGVGAILHDIGKVNLSESLLNKPGPLTDSEFDEVKRHTEYGFEILRKIYSIHLAAAHIAYQHHERLDASGYPRGLSGEEIHPWSRITAIADVYDALTADRPYRRGFRPDEALKMIHENMPIRFEELAVTHLIKKLAVYPQGTVVRLNNGYVGVVVRQTSVSSKPIVRVLADPESLLTNSYEVDLSQAPGQSVSLVLPTFPPHLLRQRDSYRTSRGFHVQVGHPRLNP